MEANRDEGWEIYEMEILEVFSYMDSERTPELMNLYDTFYIRFAEAEIVYRKQRGQDATAFEENLEEMGVYNQSG
jgi:hypothetical protein